MNNLSVVLCTYNEEKFIGRVLKKLIKRNIVKEIIIIDDNSQDKTIEIINKFKNKKIKLFVRKKIRGFASALNYGIMKSNFNNILRFDVDMYSDIDYFLNSFHKYKHKDCIIFSRYIKNGKDRLVITSIPFLSEKILYSRSSARLLLTVSSAINANGKSNDNIKVYINVLCFMFLALKIKT